MLSAGQFQGRPTEVFSEEGAVTSSSLNIILASQDNGKSLVCRAENKVTLHCDTITLWHCNTMTLWHSDTLTL